MAVYTDLSDQQVSEFLEDYDLGTLERFEGIAQGVSNSNFHVFTDQGRYILTLFEERRVNKDDLPFFFAFSAHLSENGISTPRALSDKQGNTIKTLAGKPATILNFLEGRDIPTSELTAAHCRSFGEGLAKIHKASEGFDETCENSMGPSKWKELAANTASRADSFEAGLKDFIARELEFVVGRWPVHGQDGLAVGPIHADMFPDNVFFVDGRMNAVIDFYFSCTDFLAYDVAICINAWCFNADHSFSDEKYAAFMEGYGSVRPLNEPERNYLPLFCRAAALRILLTRLEEYLDHDPDTLMMPHDPGEYLAKIRYYQERELAKVI